MDIQTVVSLAVIAGTCTWTLSRALAKVEAAVAAHVAKDEAKHAEQDARILKFETNKRRR